MKMVLVFIFLTFSLLSYGMTSGRVDENGHFSNVHHIRFSETEISCTGTVVGSKSLLTAAHCIENLKLDDVLILFVNGEPFEVEEMLLSDNSFWAKSKLFDQYHRNSWSSSSRRKRKIMRRKKGNINEALAMIDLVIIKIKGQFSKKIEKTFLNLTEPTLGDSIVCVGFGGLENTESFIPQYREELVANTGKGFIEIHSQDKNDYITTYGDSGSPLLLASSNEQVGVLRGRILGKKYNISAYVPLSRHKDFLESNIE